MLKLDDLVRQKGKDATVPARWQRLVDFLFTGFFGRLLSAVSPMK